MKDNTEESIKWNMFTCYSEGDPDRMFKQFMFKDVYLYLMYNTLLSHKAAIRRNETLTEKIFITRFIIVRVITTPGKESAVLAISESCIDRINSRIFAGHQGIIIMNLTINEKFFIPDVIYYLRTYIKGCHTCQLHKRVTAQTISK